MKGVAMLRFRSGPTALAIAVGAVESLGRSREDVPHIATILSSANDPRTGPTSPTSQTSRLLQLRHGNHRAEVIVDGPLGLYEVMGESVTPLAMRASRFRSVAGFARANDELLILLDAAELVAVVSGGHAKDRKRSAD